MEIFFFFFVSKDTRDLLLRSYNFKLSVCQGCHLSTFWEVYVTPRMKLPVWRSILAFEDSYNINCHFGHQRRHFRTFWVADVIPRVKLSHKTPCFGLKDTLSLLLRCACIKLNSDFGNHRRHFRIFWVAYVILRVKLLLKEVFLVSKGILRSLSLLSWSIIALV